VRKYGAHSYSGERNQGAIEIGQTHATITLGPSQPTVVAGILARTIDPPTGAVIGLLLDRLVVSHYTESVGGWKVSGAYVTELTRDPPPPPSVPAT
jgi:hypothetical protein